MVKKREYSNYDGIMIPKEFSCELCGEKFGNNFGLAEHHEIHECKVGHEVRMAFWRGEIESPLSGKLRKDKETEKQKDSDTDTIIGLDKKKKRLR